MPLALIETVPVVADANAPEGTDAIPAPWTRPTKAGTDFSDRNVICRHCGNTALIEVAAFSTPSLYPECCNDVMALPSLEEVDGIRSGKRGVPKPMSKCSGCKKLHPLKEGAYCKPCRRATNRAWMRARRAEKRVLS